MTKTRGYRRIAGTDWPIEVGVRRDGPRRYAAYEICNGIGVWERRFSTKREATQAAEERIKEG